MKETILGFWFGAPGSRGYGDERQEWFRKDARFDDAIRDRFGEAIATALAGGYAEWTDARGMLARVLLLDQFTRNSYRGTPRAFAGDALALGTSREAIARGQDTSLIAVERWFLYMPFVHAEDVAAQENSVALFRRLRDQTGLAAPLKWAERHADVVRRFGRFPHRNAILGRASTPDELAFLSTMGSSF